MHKKVSSSKRKSPSFFSVSFLLSLKILMPCLTVLTIIIFLFVNSLFMRNLKESEISELNEYNMVLYNTISQDIAIAETLSKDEKIRYGLKQFGNLSYGEKNMVSKDFHAKFRQYAISHPEIVNVYVFTDAANGLTFESILPIPHESKYFSKYFTDNNIILNDEYSYNNYYLPEYLDKEKIGIIYPILDNDDINLGYICINLSKDYLYKKYIYSPHSREVKYFVVNNSNKIIMSNTTYDNENNIVLSKIKNINSGVTSFKKYNSKLSFIAYSKRNPLSWTVISVSPFSASLHWLFPLIMFSLITLLLIYMLCYIFSYRLASFLNNPLKILVSSIRNKEKVSVVSSLNIQEYMAIGNELNDMLDNVQKLLAENSEKTKKNAELELKTLISQINPHFLHNTLNFIMWKAITLNDLELANIISKLGKFCQFAYQYDSPFWSIKSEISHIILYLDLQKKCFKDKFTYDINIDDKFMNYYIPRFVLQPLIENSIKHGFFQSSQKNHIAVTAETANDCLLLTIEDNGLGIDPDMLEKLNSCKYRSLNYGVYNVSQRIKLLYGEEYGLSFNSKANSKTTVTIKLKITERID